MGTTSEDLAREALEIDRKLWNLEQKRRKLDREILHLEFAAQGLEGTLADKRRAAARVRNSKLIESIELLEAKMRTRKLSHPLTSYRQDLIQRYLQQESAK